MLSSEPVSLLSKALEPSDVTFRLGKNQDLFPTHEAVFKPYYSSSPTHTPKAQTHLLRTQE